MGAPGGPAPLRTLTHWGMGPKAEEEASVSGLTERGFGRASVPPAPADAVEFGSATSHNAGGTDRRPCQTDSCRLLGDSLSHIDPMLPTPVIDPELSLSGAGPRAVPFRGNDVFCYSLDDAHAGERAHEVTFLRVRAYPHVCAPGNELTCPSATETGLPLHARADGGCKPIAVKMSGKKPLSSRTLTRSRTPASHHFPARA